MTDYIERMKVREILTECGDIDAEATSYVLHDIDQLPAIVVPAQEQPTTSGKMSVDDLLFAFKTWNFAEGGPFNSLDRAKRCMMRAVQIIEELRGSPAERGDGNRAIPFDRNALGRMVREAWVRWALTQPNPKPSWLAPYDDLDERDKEADRQIGEAIARWTLIGDAASSQSPAASADRQTLSEQERHAVEHARFQADRATPGDPECCFDFELVKTLVQIVDRRSPAVTDAMCEAALDADAPDRIQGFSYSKRHVIRDVWANKEIWCAPVGSPEDHQAFQRQCQIERMRRALEAALGCPSQPVSDDEPDTNDGEDYLNARRGHPGTVKNLSEPRG
jgi:hypothetical protein